MTTDKARSTKTCSPDGRSAEAISFRALNQLNLKTSRAWCIKENFTQFWSYSYKGAAKRFFKAWSTNAMRSKLEPVKKVVLMLRRHECEWLFKSALFWLLSAVLIPLRQSIT